jgi:hypothetical protein
LVVPTLYLFDRWDERIGILLTLGTMMHSEELGVSTARRRRGHQNPQGHRRHNVQTRREHQSPLMQGRVGGRGIATEHHRVTKSELLEAFGISYGA